jgi:hypothetical protein
MYQSDFASSSAAPISEGALSVAARPPRGTDYAPGRTMRSAEPCATRRCFKCGGRMYPVEVSTLLFKSDGWACADCGRWVYKLEALQ